MSWAAVAGLAVLAAAALPVLCLARETLRHRRREALENRIREADDALRKAIDEEPGNLAEHQRLRAELVRLRGRRDVA